MNPNVLLLQDLWRRAAARVPEAWAVVHHGDRRTYARLSGEARRLAAHLRARGVGPESCVGLALPRGCDQMVALLAILEAGGAYVPLDVTLPAGRLAAMATDAGLACVIAPDDIDLPLPPRVQRLDPARLPAESPPFEPPTLHPDNLAYVLFTSGSTGRPKGVAMPHRGLVRLIEWQCRTSHKPAMRTLQFAPLGFDVSFQECFATWAGGGTLVLVDEEERRDPERLLDVIARGLDEELRAVPAGTAGELFLSGDCLARGYIGRPDLTAERFLPDPGGSVGRAAARSARVAMICDAPLDGWQQWGERLCEDFPPFRAALDALRATTPAIAAAFERMSRGEPSTADVAVVAFACGAALARTWASFGCRPEVLVGDGLRGVVAAHAAGVLSVDDAVAWAAAGPAAALREQVWGPGDVSLLDGRGEPLRREVLADPARWAEAAGTSARDGRIRTASAQGATVVIDLVASGPVERQVAGVDVPGVVVPAGPPSASPATGLVAALAAAWAAGVPLDFAPLFPPGTRMVQDLPTYAFQRERYWIEARPRLPAGGAAASEPSEPSEPSAAAPVADPTWSHEESELVRIWREIFGVPSLGLHDSFLDLGGSSLLATEVARRAARVGLAVEPRDLLRHPTVAELACRLRAGRADVRDSILLPLRRSGREQPLILAPPLEGNVWYLRELKDALRESLPVWVFDESALAQRGPLPESIGALAAVYVDELVATLPGHASYRIGGYSFGGVVAVEMARQLVDRGHAVAPVLLLDAPAGAAVLFPEHRSCCSIKHCAAKTPKEQDSALFMVCLVSFGALVA